MERKRFIVNTTTKPDRLAYLWLAIALVLSLFANGRWAIPLAVWLAPVFLLRFVRIQKVLWGVTLALCVNFVAMAFVCQELLRPLSFGLATYLIALGFAILTTLPYLADRLIATRLQGFMATLIFPLAYTSMEYLNSLINPFGTYLSIAYTQYGNLPLVQLVSVTGIWGLTFLISWLAPVVNWAWERGFGWSKVRGGSLLYGGMLALILLAGGTRLSLFPAEANTVRVAGITSSQATLADFAQHMRQMPDNKFRALSRGTATEADRQVARSVFARLNNELFTLSQQEAHAGAKIVFWSEATSMVLKEDEAALLARGKELARQEGIYLDMTVGVFLRQPEKSQFVENKTILIDPSGNVVWQYLKSHPVPGEPIVPGDGRIPTVDTAYGRMSNVICYDMDFPSFVWQAGRAGTDLMLVPANDFREHDPLHTQMASFRAIENGFILVRQAQLGLSMAVDYEGRVLATSDFFSTDQQTMIAYVPIHGVRTIYATIGDLFAWLSIAGLLFLTGLVIVRRRQIRKTPARGFVEVVPEPELVH